MTSGCRGPRRPSGLPRTPPRPPRDRVPWAAAHRGRRTDRGARGAAGPGRPAGTRIAGPRRSGSPTTAARRGGGQRSGCCHGRHWPPIGCVREPPRQVRCCVPSPAGDSDMRAAACAGVPRRRGSAAARPSGPARLASQQCLATQVPQCTAADRVRVAALLDRHGRGAPPRLRRARRGAPFRPPASTCSHWNRPRRRDGAKGERKRPRILRERERERERARERESKAQRPPAESVRTA